MQIEVSFPNDATRYFCMNCNSFVDGTYINKHIRSMCPRDNTLKCSICHIHFKSLKKFLTHEGTHDNTPKRQTVVSFNNECDKEFNNHLSLIESQSRKSSTDVPLSQLRQLLMSDSAKAKYKLYKCARCELCVTLKSSIKRHRCVSGNSRRFCEICEQYFCAKKSSLHLEAHRKKPYINKHSFYVIYFNGGPIPNKALSTSHVATKGSPKKDTSAKISPKKELTAKISPRKELTAKVSPKKLVFAKIYECKCGLHYTSMKTVEKHLEECNPKLEVSKETCSKCKLVFPTDVLVTHLINHHHKETKIVIEKIAKSNLLKCPNCAIIFINMRNFNAHMKNCFQKNGTQCKNCRLTFGQDCFPKHLCSSVDKTYINKITVVRKNIVKQATVYRCTSCDITYLARNSFRYHAHEVNHQLKKPPTMCDICGLKFTNCSLVKHLQLHSVPTENFKIKIIDPLIGSSEFITGSNRSKDTDSKKSHRKRRGEELDETDSAPVKKVKEIPEIDVPLTERGRSRKAGDRLSTSRYSRLDLDETPIETNVPDTISAHITENIGNISDFDTDTTEMTSPDKINETLDTSGISKKLKSRILVNGYSKELYRCVRCNQHYMKEASFDYHVKTNHNIQTENYECDICGLEFSRYTLPRHKYVHHDHMGLNREDFVILLSTPYSREKDAKTKNSSKILDVSSEILDIKESENDTTEFNHVNVSDDSGTKELSDVIVSDNRGTKELGDIKVSDNSGTKELTDLNVSDNCDNKELSDVNVSDNCDTEQPGDVNMSDNCDAEELGDVNMSDNCDTEELSDVNMSDICDSNTKLPDNISDIDKICYYKCSDCNVCFVDHKMCYEHMLKHEILDPKTYIQCKICDFQFLIDSLKEHMVLHHNSDFRIESLTIQEYKASGVGSEPKVDIYQAVDKVQSRLVSTTTDVGVV